MTSRSRRRAPGEFTSRTKARKRAADVLFEADQRGMGRDPRVLEDLLRERRVLTAALTPLPEYSVRIVSGVAQNLRRIDDLIEAHATDRDLDRIAPVDLAVMRVAVWEMLENTDDVPPVTAIDQAVVIVKSISTDASPTFVNAVLDAVRRDVGAPAWSRRRVTAPAPQAAPASSDEGDSPAGPSRGPADETPAAPAQDDEDTTESPTDDDSVGSPADGDSGESSAPAGATSTADGPPDNGAAQTPEQTPTRRHPTVEDLTSADMETLDELLDEY